MARQRSFDEDVAVTAAAALFTRQGYEGTSVDDLVVALGVHRGSLYRTFGSKVELFHRALRTHVETVVLPWVDGLHDAPRGALAEAVAGRGADLGLVLVAAVERAAVDPIAAVEVERVFAALRTALLPGGYRPLAAALAAAVVGLHVQTRAGLSRTRAANAAAALAERLRV